MVFFSFSFIVGVIQHLNIRFGKSGWQFILAAPEKIFLLSKRHCNGPPSGRKYKREMFMRQALEQASQGFAFFHGKGKMAEMRCRWGVYIDFSGVYRYYKPMRSRKKTGGSARIIFGENGLIIGGITCGKL